jgi:hypothetical protein
LGGHDALLEVILEILPQGGKTQPAWARVASAMNKRFPGVTTKEGGPLFTADNCCDTHKRLAGKHLHTRDDDEGESEKFGDDYAALIKGHWEAAQKIRQESGQVRGAGSTNFGDLVPGKALRSGTATEGGAVVMHYQDQKPPGYRDMNKDVRASTASGSLKYAENDLLDLLLTADVQRRRRH